MSSFCPVQIKLEWVLSVGDALEVMHKQVYQQQDIVSAERDIGGDTVLNKLISSEKDCLEEHSCKTGVSVTTEVRGRP